MSDFFEKLKKGMNVENIPDIKKEESEPKRIDKELFAEEVIANKPEVVSASVSFNASGAANAEKKESKRKKVRKKSTVSKKTSKKKEICRPAEKEENKIKVKNESSFAKISAGKEDDIFKKDGQLTVDVFETDKYVVIQSAIAGVEPNNLDITIEKDMVSIKGKRERIVEEEAENYFYQECYWGRFSREIVLPCEVDKSRAEAIMKNGILTIKIPKTNSSNAQKLNIRNIE